MRVYWKDTKASIWRILNESGKVECVQEEGNVRIAGPTPKAKKALSIIRRLGKLELHIPIPEEYLQQWRKELPYHGNSDYGKILARDIRMAEKCNERGCEMILAHCGSGQ